MLLPLPNPNPHPQHTCQPMEHITQRYVEAAAARGWECVGLLGALVNRRLELQIT